MALLLAVAACGLAATAQAAPPRPAPAQLCSGGPISVVEVFERSGLVVPSAAWTFRGAVVGTGHRLLHNLSRIDCERGTLHCPATHARIPACWWPGTVL